MKIVLVDESIDRIGGVERVISTLANKLSINNDVKVISEFKEKKERFYEYDKNIKIRYLIENVNENKNRLKSKNLKYYFYRIIEKIKIKLTLNSKIQKSIYELKEADVIIFGRVFVALDFLPILQKNNIKAKIIVRDAIHLEYYSQKVKNKMLTYFPKMVNKFIVSSEESIDTYKKFFENDEIDIIKIYNPLGIEPVSKYDFSAKTIVSIGRLDKQKGFENLINAFKRVHDLHSDWKLKIYGNGNYEQVLENEIQKIEAKEYIEILPSIKNVVQVLNASSIFVLPSRYEGYANILVEAMSCGIPCISYNWLMGVEEIITDNIDGFVVKLQDRKKYFEGNVIEEDIKNLADKIIYAIENEDTCKRIGKEAEKIINTRKFETIIKQWIKIIQK